MDANQAVARLISLKATPNHALVTNVNYMPGQFYRFVKGAAPNTKSMQVSALVFRGDTVAVAKEGMLLALNDHICTGPSTLAAIEFLIGGRASINQSTEAVIDTERSVHDVNGPSAMQIIRALLGTNQLRRPIEIQTNGGTMGIKG